MLNGIYNFGIVKRCNSIEVHICKSVIVKHSFFIPNLYECLDSKLLIPNFILKNHP